MQNNLKIYDELDIKIGELPETQIRRTVLPMFEIAIKKLLEKQIDNESFKKDLIKAFEKIITKIDFKLPEKQRVEVDNQIKLPKVQKVEVVNQEKKIKLQKVEDLELRKQVKELNILVNELIETVNNQPRPQKLPEVMPVRIENWEHVATSASDRKNGEKVWLYEKYYYTTISGIQQPTKIEKWDDQNKLTENYKYDANSNPVVKSRTLEPHNGVGA